VGLGVGLVDSSTIAKIMFVFRLLCLKRREISVFIGNLENMKVHEHKIAIGKVKPYKSGCG
jgi:hypothetical protein